MGRPARHIHWKASARHDRLLEKMCETSERERVLIVLCGAGFESEPELEACLEVVASLAVQLEHARHPVGLATDACLKGGSSAAVGIAHAPGQLPQLLETLARFQPAPGRDVIELLSGSALLSSSASVIAVSHTLAVAEPLLAYLRMRRVPVIQLVSRCADAELSRGRVHRLADLRGAP